MPVAVVENSFKSYPGGLRTLIPLHHGRHAKMSHLHPLSRSSEHLWRQRGSGSGTLMKIYCQVKKCLRACATPFILP